MIRRYLTIEERRAMYEAQEERCASCRTEIRDERDCIAEHTHPVAMGNDQKPDCLLCRACAHLKTNGTAATSYGSDQHEIAKMRRLRKARLAKEEAESRVALALPKIKTRPKGKISSRPFAKGKRSIPKPKDPWGKARARRRTSDE